MKNGVVLSIALVAAYVTRAVRSHVTVLEAEIANALLFDKKALVLVVHFQKFTTGIQCVRAVIASKARLVTGFACSCSGLCRSSLILGALSNIGCSLLHWRRWLLVGFGL